MVFLPGIVIARHEFLEAFNNHKVRTMQNWSPYQGSVNMTNPENPMLTSQPDEMPENVEFYGCDPNGPNPFENSDNAGVVPPIDI